MASEQQKAQQNSFDADTSRNTSHWRFRKLKDLIMRRMVELGGISVILAIALIFIFLLSVVWPLFQSASSNAVANYAIPQAQAGQTLHLSIEEQAEIGMRVTDSGTIVFFDIENGAPVTEKQLAFPADVQITAFQIVDQLQGLFAVGLSDGSMLVFRHSYRLDYSGERRVIHPVLSYPFGEEQLQLIEGQTIAGLSVGSNEDAVTVIFETDTGGLFLKSFNKESSFLDEDVATLEDNALVELESPGHIFSTLINPEQEWAYALSIAGNVYVYDVRDPANPVFKESVQLLERDAEPTLFAFLTGGISLLVGDDQGELAQWFQVRTGDERRSRLQKIRSQSFPGQKITSLSAEQLRKGMLVGTDLGIAHLLYSTSERELLDLQVSNSAITHAAVAPRANYFVVQDEEKQLHVYHVDSEHPEVSWDALWGKVWYEDYVEPDFIWQSSSASSDFEPKFSLTPLTFGTLKAAFYAMLFAMPLAILGAIFTAYFMAPKMRGYVKPSIEIMEALPTVILGFLAGLWLAPFVEKHLPGVFSVLLLMPLGVLLVAYIWWRLPGHIKTLIPDGWQAAVLIPPILFIGWLCLAMSPIVEAQFFGGNVRLWMNESLGIGFDQRNALIIGIAMGFAVIPTIFSIAEDAIFSVPKHLTSGSLALGATPWQSLVRVVLPSASPGIFSATMIGFGRAVGETMIVLMATGNTPVMDFSIFEGMRTLSANVAVELPESEVDSSHYRILFLAALVLFAFTFFLNTIAEIVRQRLRKKYSNL